MKQQIVLKNGHDLHQSLSLNILPVILDQLIRQTPLGDILLEIPCDTAVPSHCDFCVYICSFLYIIAASGGEYTQK